MTTSETYIELLADRIRAKVPPGLLPEEGDVRALFLVYAALALAKRERVDARDVHNAWAAWMATAHPSHESIQPFDELTHETQREDEPYVHAIRAAVAELDRD